MSVTYKITTVGILISNPDQLGVAVFENYNQHKGMFFDPAGEVLVTFDSPQTPADLGPLVKVEVISA